MFAMGYFCEMGIGTEKDAEKALAWYSRAAEMRDPKAMKKLNEMGMAAGKGKRGGVAPGCGIVGEATGARSGSAGSQGKKKKEVGKCVIM